MANDLLIRSSQIPDPPTEKTAVMGNLSGGLNLWELDYRMDPDQSPDMKNLWWRDGVLGCRDGQMLLSQKTPGTGICCYKELFWGRAVCHIGDGLYAGVPAENMELTKLCDGLGQEGGTFLRYQDALLYKAPGVFKKILWDGSRLTAQDVAPYVPVIQINTAPDGAGDLYQPENRLTGQKTVWYTAARQTRGVSFTATGTAVEFRYETEDGEPVASVEQVYVDTTLQDESQYTLSEDRCTVTFQTAPEAGSVVSVVYTVGVRTYHLPVTEVDGIEEVLVDDTQVTDFAADLQNGTVTFPAAPPCHEPAVGNTVKITYTKENPDAKKSIMDCRYGICYGGSGGAVLILAGSQAQPNGYFWNGSHIAMDPGYFPMSYYNLAGDNLDPVTGFGQQAGYLVVLQEHGVGRCLLGSSTIGERAYLTLDYTPVNQVLGCDLPGSVHLVENNLVWCSTYAGVCRMEDTTEALENQIRCISRNINGGDRSPGLLQAVRESGRVATLEDGSRYWICAGGETYVWDHSLSTAARPSWFRFTDIPAVGFFRGGSVTPELGEHLPFTGPRRIYHLDGQGRISCFVRNFRDYGGAIEKVYQFATQTFGTYERYKNVTKLLLATRSDTDTVIHVSYTTDLQRRQDLTDIVSRSWHLWPRDLGFRYLGVQRFSHVAVRRPKCRHVQHFSLRLENNQAGCDMSIVSAQITARLLKQPR